MFFQYQNIKLVLFKNNEKRLDKAFKYYSDILSSISQLSSSKAAGIMHQQNMKYIEEIAKLKNKSVLAQ